MFAAAYVLLVAGQGGTVIPYEVIKYAGNTCYLRVGEGGGSGVIMGQKGPTSYILTSAHQILDENSIQISWFKPFSLDGEVSKKPGGPPAFGYLYGKKEPISDLALLAVDIKEMSWDRVKIPKKDTYVNPRSVVYSVGCEEEYPTIKITQLLGRKLFSTIANEYAFHWETRDITKPGRSGGPLFGPKGELLGICHGYQGDRGFYTHHLEILAFLKKNNLESLVFHE